MIKSLFYIVGVSTMKTWWIQFKRTMELRRRAESLRKMSFRLNQQISYSYQNTDSVVITKFKEQFTRLTTQFLSFINDFEIDLISKTNLNSDHIRKLLWEYQYQSTEEMLAIIDNIYRYMYSVEDGNIIGGLGKKELLIIGLTIVFIETLLFIL